MSIRSNALSVGRDLIDLCGGFGMMSQCLADDRDRDMIISCRRCPGMAGNIEGEFV